MSYQHYLLFIVGDYGSGKSSLIRSLTGSCRNKIIFVKDLSGQRLRAFVSLSAPQELGMKKCAPKIFPQYIETKYDVKRNTYDILISALELIVSNRSKARYGYEPYILSVLQQGFDVRLAVIENAWDNIRVGSQEITNIQTFAANHNIPMILVDASNDPCDEAYNIRLALYP